METVQREVISGEEFNREFRRLARAGRTEHDPEVQALFARVRQRDEKLFERYGRTLLERYPDQWVAISLDGDTIVGSDSLEVRIRARERFGVGNFAMVLLNSDRGYVLRTPRQA